MTFDDLVAAGILDLEQGDRVEVVAPTGNVVAGPLTVMMVIYAIGDCLHLVNPDGTTYMKGNMTKGDHPINFGHLPVGWRFRKVVGPAHQNPPHGQCGDNAYLSNMGWRDARRL